MWFNKSVIYQIYPFGFCGAPEKNDGVLVPRIKKVIDWIEHLVRLNIDAVYFCPVFESSAHGYDTKDYSKIDVRLGSNEDFKEVCSKLHENGIRVILDGVFNHVGRDFFAFSDVREKRFDSQYKDWFYINFDGNSCYDDGFWYEGWEGHYELVKLNLDNPEVRKYLLSNVGSWMDDYRIDGLRLDVAYMLNRVFMKELRSFCLEKNPEFFLAGEMIHGNYNDIVNDEMLHSATNYECYKGIYSSFNSMNMFEIGHSLIRQFGNENWCLYRGKHLLSFVDNHDVTRISTNLTNKNHIIPAFGVLMAMPGIPMVYYGSEWGIEGNKNDGDGALRPYTEAPVENEITGFLSKAIRIHRNEKCLYDGSFEILHMTNKQLVFERACGDERIIVLINADDTEYYAHFNANAGCGTELISGRKFDFGGGSVMPPYSVQYVKIGEYMPEETVSQQSSGFSCDISEYLKSSESETVELLEKLCRIPAPSNHEEKRAEFCKSWLEENGAGGVYIDQALNVLYPVGCDGKNDIVLFLAHTDTVFPDTEPMDVHRDGEYICSPGVGDDTVCLAMLMMIARYVAKSGIKAPCGILFAANSGEEGLGNLKGIRQIMKDFDGRIKEVITFDSNYTSCVSKPVGSHRYEITFETEGGHSYGAFGNRNAVFAASDFVCRLYDCELPAVGDSKTTYNVGLIEGGTSVNTIAQNARVLYEYRSDNTECLERMKSFFERTVEQAKKDGKAEISVETVGIRPCAGEVDEKRLAELCERVVSVCKKHSGLDCRLRSGSSDANIPMSMGIPAVNAGCYIGEGAHTREERVLLSSIPTGLKIVADIVLGYFEKSGNQASELADTVDVYR